MIALVGEQPASNLLPVRYLKPNHVVLVHTDQTWQVAKNLKGLLQPSANIQLLSVDAYDLLKIERSLSSFLSCKILASKQLIFNFTGGTKPMSVAAFRLAQETRSVIIYFKSQGNRSTIYSYRFASNGEIELESVEEVPDTISLDEYLRSYLGSYQEGKPRNNFEQQVFESLTKTPEISEVKASITPCDVGALEIDFAIRCGNQVGIAEVKMKGAKKGIDQLNAAAEQRYLGTYVRKFLIAGRKVDKNIKDLASAYRIIVLELLSAESGILSPNDSALLVKTVRNQLGGKP